MAPIGSSPDFPLLLYGASSARFEAVSLRKEEQDEIQRAFMCDVVGMLEWISCDFVNVIEYKESSFFVPVTMILLEDEVERVLRPQRWTKQRTAAALAEKEPAC